jgi:hypothetical protein
MKWKCIKFKKEKLNTILQSQEGGLELLLHELLCTLTIAEYQS